MDKESALEAIYEDDYADEEMMDASEDAQSEEGEIKQCAFGAPQHSQFKFGNDGLNEQNAPAAENDLEKVISSSKYVSQSKPHKKKKKKSKKRDNSIYDINRFVINTCKQLQEPKSFLVWEAIRTLGVSAVKNFVDEVFTIEKHGGQMTADGKRHRTPGGILWNILKSREPEAFKEIMLKGKEFEKQLRKENSKFRASDMGGQPYGKRNKTGSAVLGRNDGDQNVESTSINFSEPCKDRQQDLLVKSWLDGIRTSNAVLENGCRVDNVQQIGLSEKVKLPVKDRIRVPVGYDDLIVEDTTDTEVKREENGQAQDSI